MYNEFNYQLVLASLDKLNNPLPGYLAKFMLKKVQISDTYHKCDSFCCLCSENHRPYFNSLIQETRGLQSLHSIYFNSEHTCVQKMLGGNFDCSKDPCIIFEPIKCLWDSTYRLKMDKKHPSDFIPLELTNVDKLRIARDGSMLIIIFSV